MKRALLAGAVVIRTTVSLIIASSKRGAAVWSPSFRRQGRGQASFQVSIYRASRTGNRENSRCDWSLISTVALARCAESRAGGELFQ